MKCDWAKLWSFLFTIVIRKKLCSPASVPFCWQIYPCVNDIVVLRSWKGLSRPEMETQTWNEVSLFASNISTEMLVFCCALMLWEIFGSPSQAYILNLFE